MDYPRRRSQDAPRSKGGRKRPTSSGKTAPGPRRLRCEPLEDRRLLAVVAVTTLEDTVDFADGVTSLREAIFATNTVPGADEIQFAPSLFSEGAGTILLTGGELKISDSLTITGPGAATLTIDAFGSDPTPGDFRGDGSRIFNIDDGLAKSAMQVGLSGMTLTHADAFSIGGAIISQERLQITDLTLTENGARNAARRSSFRCGRADRS